MIAQIAQPLQPMIDIEKPWLSPHAFAPNPSNPMESEMLPIDQVFRTVHLVLRLGAAMRPRSRAGGEPAKAQRPKTGAQKRRVTSEAARPSSSSAAREETKVVRLNREPDEARSTFDLQVVFKTLLESAAKLCEADFANIWRPYGPSYRVAATYQTSAAYKEYLANL